MVLRLRYAVFFYHDGVFLIRDIVKLLCPIVSSLHYVVFLLCCWDIIWRDVVLRLRYGVFLFHDNVFLIHRVIKLFCRVVFALRLVVFVL